MVTMPKKNTYVNIKNLLFQHHTETALQVIDFNGFFSGVFFFKKQQLKLTIVK
jgi:hypothetical protein